MMTSAVSMAISACSLICDNIISLLSGSIPPVSINVNALSFSYEPYKEILSNIYFSAQNQESIGIIGANGVGKSTFLKLLVGLLTTPYGQIFINDLLVKKDNLSILREKIGYVFQDSNHQLFMSTVFEDVAFAPRHYGYPSNEVN